MRGIGKFKAEYFDSAEDGFHNLLSQKMGKTKSDLRCVICNRVVTEVFPDVAMERMHQIRLSREAFCKDNHTVLRMLKEYLINSLGWSCIDRFNTT